MFVSDYSAVGGVHIYMVTHLCVNQSPHNK
jgi:hypothetical protein